jgi:DNA uptake protein ComE-like DNA-binding protein
LSFTKGETKGIFVLLGILLILILIHNLSELTLKRKPTDFSQFKDEIKVFESSLQEFNSSDISISKFKFNPNTTDKEEWKSLGLNEKQIKTIQNYVSKGGRFYIKSDLKKIYGISENDYKQLEPYIDLPENQEFDYTRHVKNDYYNHENTNTELFYFDPNVITDSEWMNLGFSEKQVKVIRKYIEAGGKFRKAQDLKKIFVISEEKYNELKDYVKIDEDLLNNDISQQETDNNSKDIEKIDINSFTPEQFIEMGGNWKYYGQRIVKYRNLLGGYYSKEQLMEVYGFKQEFYEQISGLIYIDETKIIKLNINFSEPYELEKHPYISKETAGKIISYRNKKGALKDINELYLNNVVDSDTYHKIKHYLTVN